MDEIKTPKEGSTANNPEKTSGRPFSEEWTEAWKQLEERVRRRPGPPSSNCPLHRIPSADYSFSKPFSVSRKALLDIGATRTLPGLRFPVNKIYEEGLEIRRRL
jgi:hypothetical protein